MAITAAASNSVQLGYVAEVTFGTTPNSPTYQLIRFTGESINFSITNTKSNEIRSDRMTPDTVQTGATVGGSLNIELSYGSYDDMILAVLATTAWSTPPTSISHSASGNNLTIAVSGANNTITAASGTPFSTFTSLTNGEWIKVAGLTGTGNTGNKWMKLAATPTSTVLTVTSVSGGALSATTVSSGTQTFKVGAFVKNGATQKSFSFYKGLTDLANPTNFPQFVFAGCRINNWTLNFAVGSILTGTFEVMGLGATVSTTSAPTTSAPSTSGVMNAVGHVNQVYIDGVAATSTYFNKLDMTYSNNVRGQTAIGVLGNAGIALGSVTITGNIEVYFADTTMYDKYLAGTAFGLTFMVKDTNTTSDGNVYIIEFPRVKFTSSTVVASGLNQDVNMSGQWEALVDAGGTHMMKVHKIATGAT
jgi:hypothetical protein